jgi:hypothetical protein
MTEDDTFRILKRDSFDVIMNRIADKSKVDRKRFRRHLTSEILNGSKPNTYFDTIWQGWTFEEVVQEVIKRKTYNDD